jgi:hypothetical protein
MRILLVVVGKFDVVVDNVLRGGRFGDIAGGALVGIGHYSVAEEVDQYLFVAKNRGGMAMFGSLRHCELSWKGKTIASKSLRCRSCC